MHSGKWAILLSAFWLLLSGYIQPLLLSFGVISVALVVYVLKRMDTVDQEPKRMSSGSRMMRYLVWLLGQIMSSSIHVTKLVWGSKAELSPTLERIPAHNIPASKRALYANSITLTPGTLSVDLENDHVTVHALQKSSIDEIKEGEMERKITSIWKQQ
ncbi:MAG: Na+/H+ antiporter subunit E [Oleiphilaceae bacterium]|nr:Na+/H+ antiporter subunit E [Oleiphilaceae bacterium]